MFSRAAPTGTANIIDFRGPGFAGSVRTYNPGGRHGILETVLRPHLAVGNKKDFHLGVESAEEGAPCRPVNPDWAGDGPVLESTCAHRSSAGHTNSSPQHG